MHKTPVPVHRGRWHRKPHIPRIGSFIISAWLNTIMISLAAPTSNYSQYLRKIPTFLGTSSISILPNLQYIFEFGHMDIPISNMNVHQVFWKVIARKEDFSLERPSRHTAYHTW